MRNPVAALDRTTRDRRLLDSFKKGDRLRQSERHQGEWLVRSSQDPHVWYRVSYDREQGRYSCGCKWWRRSAWGLSTMWKALPLSRCPAAERGCGRSPTMTGGGGRSCCGSTWTHRSGPA